MKIKLTANKRVRLDCKEPFFVPEKLSLKFESEYRLEKLSIEVKANDITKNYIICDKKLDLTEFTQKPCIIEISIALIVDGKAVKHWEIEPITVEEVNHEFVLKNYIESLVTPLQAELLTLKQGYEDLIGYYNTLGANHNELALTVKEIKENY